MANLPGKGVPIIGPWIGRIGQVADIMATPCDVDPEVWVYAFFNGVPRMLVGLFKPTPEDYMTERFGRPHKRIRRGRFMVHDILEAVDPGPGLGWKVFKILGWKERVGWWFAIIDAGVELSYHWSSMAYQWSGCATPDVAGARLVMTQDNYDVPNGGYWGNWNVVHTAGGVTADIGGINVPANFQGSISFKAMISRPSEAIPPATQVILRLVDVLSNSVLDEFEARPEPDKPAGLASISRLWFGLSPEHRYMVQQVSSNRYYRVDAEMQFYGSRDIGVTHDP